MGCSSLKVAVWRWMLGAPPMAHPLLSGQTLPSMACLTGKSDWEKSALASANLAVVSGVLVPAAHFNSNSLKTKLPSPCRPGPNSGNVSSGKVSIITPVMLVKVRTRPQCHSPTGLPLRRRVIEPSLCRASLTLLVAEIDCGARLVQTVLVSAGIVFCFPKSGLGRQHDFSYSFNSRFGQCQFATGGSFQFGSRRLLVISS